MPTPRTIIRIGAAHYDIRMSLGEVRTHVDLAEKLYGLPLSERLSILSGVGNIVCKVHDIEPKVVERPKKAKPFVNTDPRPRKASPRKVMVIDRPRSMSMLVRRDASL